MNICGDKKQVDIDHSQKKLVLFPATLLLARPWKLVGVQKKEGVQSQHHDFFASAQYRFISLLVRNAALVT